MVGHIKSIRCSGLAQNLSDTILNLRADEIKASRPFRIVSSVTSAIAQVPLLVSPVAAFALFQGVAAASGETLHATRLFSALSLIILLAQPLFFMFEVILDMSAALGSFERIQTFLTQESRRDPRQQQSVVESNTPDQGDRESVELQILREPSLQSTANSSMSDVVIQLSNANISWSEDRVILRDLSFTVGRNQFVLLLGPVASGKTTLLKALLGEVPCTTGSINIHSKGIAWCEQSPWLLV
jgi:ATP-binding cassette, subfamily C (CFTR/MRP), member 1